MGTRFDNMASIPQKTTSYVTKVLLFLASLALSGWMGLFSFSYGFGCGMGMGEGFGCRVISPYFFFSTFVLLVFSFFVSNLLRNPKKLIIWSSVILHLLRSRSVVG